MTVCDSKRNSWASPDALQAVTFKDTNQSDFQYWYCSYTKTRIDIDIAQLSAKCQPDFAFSSLLYFNRWYKNLFYFFFLIFLEVKTALFNPREKFMKFLQIWPKPELHGQWQKNPDTFVLSLSGRTDFFHPRHDLLSVKVYFGLQLAFRSNSE